MKDHPMADCTTYPLEIIKKLEERIKELEERCQDLEWRLEYEDHNWLAYDKQSLDNTEKV